MLGAGSAHKVIKVYDTELNGTPNLYSGNSQSSETDLGTTKYDTSHI